MENNEEKVIKTDKELVEERISELETAISQRRSTGKTYRAINNIIEKLFNLPIGSQILLVDDPPIENNDTEKIHGFIKCFTDRMERDFPNIRFKIKYQEPGVVTVSRMSETYQEVAQRRLKQWKKKLSELN